MSNLVLEEAVAGAERLSDLLLPAAPSSETSDEPLPSKLAQRLITCGYSVSTTSVNAQAAPRPPHPAHIRNIWLHPGPKVPAQWGEHAIVSRGCGYGHGPMKVLFEVVGTAWMAGWKFLGNVCEDCGSFVRADHAAKIYDDTLDAHLVHLGCVYDLLDALEKKRASQ